MRAIASLFGCLAHEVQPSDPNWLFYGLPFGVDFDEALQNRFRLYDLYRVRKISAYAHFTHDSTLACTILEDRA